MPYFYFCIFCFVFFLHFHLRVEVAYEDVGPHVQVLLVGGGLVHPHLGGEEGEVAEEAEVVEVVEVELEVLQVEEVIHYQ